MFQRSQRFLDGWSMERDPFFCDVLNKNGWNSRCMGLVNTTRFSSPQRESMSTLTLYICAYIISISRGMNTRSAMKF